MEQFDRAFGNLAISKKLATRDQVEECLRIVERATNLGAVTSLPDTMIGKGYLSPENAEALIAELQSNVAPTSSANATTRGGKSATIPGYELLGKIGRGGMGIVYKARQVAMDRIVAIKVLRPSLGQNKVFLERFFREARVAAKLNHTNVVGAIDAGSAEGYHYFVMEYVDGPTVAEMLKNGPMDEIDALRITHGVALALAHAQKFGLVHRDIKPENIMLTSEGIVKLADLGLAKSSAADMSVTADGSKLGTPYYMSPEQARGSADLDFRSDIYSLGATLFHMITGARPFDGDTPAVVVSKRLTEPVPDPREIRPGISTGLNRLIRRMMQKDPARRYDSIDELIRDIEAVLRGDTLGAAHHARAAEHAPRGRKLPIGLIAGCAAGVLILGAVLFIATRERETPEEKAARLASEAYIAATDFHRKNPNDLDGAIELLEKVAKEHQGTPAARDAAEKARELRVQRAQVAAAETLVALRETCTKLTAADRYGEALKLLKAFAETNPPDAMLEEAAKLREGINKKAVRRYLDLVEASDAALREGRFDEARGALEPVSAFGIESLDRNLKEKLAAIDRKEEEARHRDRWEKIQARVRELVAREDWDGAAAELAKARELPHDLFGAAIEEQSKAIDEAREAAIAREVARREQIKRATAALQAAFDEQVAPMLADRKYEQAAAALEALAGAAEYELAADRADALRRDIARLKGFWKEVHAILAEMRPGTAITIRGKRVALAGYKNGKVSWKVGSAQAAIDISRLKGREIFGLLGGDFPRNNEQGMQAAAFALYDKDCDRALARQLLAKVDACPDLERFTIMAGGAHDYEADEEAAEKAFTRLIADATADNADKLRAEFFRNFGHTRFYNEHLFDLEKLGSREADSGDADRLGIPLLEKEPELKRALLGCWSLDGAKGGLILDSSGKKNHARVNGTIAFARGVRRAAAKLDRAHIEIPCRPGLWPKGSFTIDFCIKARSLRANYWGYMGPRIVGVGTDKYGYPEKAGGFGMRISSSYVRFYLQPGDRLLYDEDSRSSLGIDKWYHVSAVLDTQEERATVYINGEPLSTRKTGASFSSTEPLEIGGTRTRRFRGLIDEFHLWALPLSRDQVAALADGWGLGPGGVTSRIIEENKKAIEGFKEKLTQKIAYECSNVPLHYAVVGVLNRAGVPYQWERSDRLTGDLTRKLVNMQEAELPAAEMLLGMLEPINLSYEVDDDGVVLVHRGGEAPAGAEGRDERDIENRLRDPVTLKIPYPEYMDNAPPHQITIPYAVKVILAQVGVPFSFEASVRNLGPIANKWITPSIEQRSCKEALDIILRPELLTYTIRNGKLVLERQ